MPRVRNRSWQTRTRDSRQGSQRVHALSQDIRSGQSDRTRNYINGGPPNRPGVSIRDFIYGSWTRGREPIPGIDGAVGWGMGA